MIHLTDAILRGEAFLPWEALAFIVCANPSRGYALFRSPFKVNAISTGRAYAPILATIHGAESFIRARVCKAHILALSTVASIGTFSAEIQVLLR